MSLFPIFLHSSYSHVRHLAVKGPLDTESTEPNVPATSKSALAHEAAGSCAPMSGRSWPTTAMTSRPNKVRFLEPAAALG